MHTALLALVDNSAGTSEVLSSLLECWIHSQVQNTNPELSFKARKTLEDAIMGTVMIGKECVFLADSFVMQATSIEVEALPRQESSQPIS